jgi:glycerol kinase
MHTSCSTRFIIFDKSGTPIATHQKEHAQIYPEPGWSEHDPLQIWERTVECIAGALKTANIDPSQLKAVGITNQRETTLVWNKKTGKPYCNAIVWHDARTKDIVHRRVQPPAPVTSTSASHRQPQPTTK